ncbi:hypothetical protein V8V91_08575 [Algoriphagus halophilus]|uniref:hypothetical protein n=1 Tax=Algoriphagus halophilus TaxID=226505 RepID=UPI00358E99A3
MKINPALKGKYEATDKVTSQKFINGILGKIDLETINDPMAEKLVKSGHLKKVSAKKKEQE